MRSGDLPPVCTDGHRPDDLPEPGDRCKDCLRRLVWIGPGPYDFEVADDEADEVMAGVNGWRWREGTERGEVTGMCGWCDTAFGTGAALIHAVSPDGTRYNVHPRHWAAFQRVFVLGYVSVQLSPDEFAVIAGLVAPTDVVNPGGIHAGEVLAGLQEKFPVGPFRAWAGRHDLDKDGVGYLPGAGT